MKQGEQQVRETQATPQPQTAHQAEHTEEKSGWDLSAEQLLGLAKNAGAYIEAGNYKKALETIERILEISPDNEKALLVKVQILLISRKLRDADKTISTVLLLYPQNHYAYLIKAIITALYTADINSAISYVESGLRIKPGCFELIIAKAQMLYWLGDPAYNLWINQASQIDTLRTGKFLEKYWIENPPTIATQITAQISGLLQKLMFVVSQQSYGGW